MNSAASTLNQQQRTELRNYRFQKDQIISELLKLFDFDKVCDSSQTISLGELEDIFKDRTDVFLTHNWGLGQSNHIRVRAINEFLKSRNILTWFDDEKMEGNIPDQMCRGIDNSRSVAVFITHDYTDRSRGRGGRRFNMILNTFVIYFHQ